MLDAPPPDFRLLRFSSDALPKADRFDLWRDVLTRKLLRVAMDPLTDAPFEAEAALRSQHGVTIALGGTGPSISFRTREIVANDNDDMVLIANLDDRFVIDAGDAELTLGPGDATLVTCTEAGRYVRPSGGKLLCVRLPRRALSLVTPDPEDRAFRLIPAAHGPLRLLLAYASAVCASDEVSIPEPMSRFVVEHVRDLVALALGARGDAAEMAAARGGRAANLKAVKSAIEARIGPTSFSVEDVAAEVGVSPRYVRKLLESEGNSFSGYVTGRRLERAHGMLTSPRSAGLTISAIAYDVGFGDLSYFNRAFRRRFERTPSEARAEG